jgi:hypothetical protein
MRKRIPKTVQGMVIARQALPRPRAAESVVEPAQRSRAASLPVQCLLCPAQGAIEVRFGRLLAKVCRRCADGITGGAQFLSWASKLFGR